MLWIQDSSLEPFGPISISPTSASPDALHPISSTCTTLARLSPDPPPSVPLLHYQPSACAALTNLFLPACATPNALLPISIVCATLACLSPDLPPPAFCLSGFNKGARGWLSRLLVPPPPRDRKEEKKEMLPPLLSRWHLTFLILPYRTATCARLTWMCCFGYHRKARAPTNWEWVAMQLTSNGLRYYLLHIMSLQQQCHPRSLSPLFGSPTPLECCKSSLSVPHRIAI
jgi:hypothetical protein